jgi:hypothetical protein
MKNNGFKIAVIAILLGGGYFIYTRVQANKKTNNVDAIINAGNSSASSKMVLETFQPEFIKAWADASTANTPTFSFENKNYNTKGGKAIKA